MSAKGQFSHITLVCFLIASSTAHAQTVDGFEFGKISGAAVKLALQLDHINQKCKKEMTPLYLNQTNFLLGQIAGGSSKLVLENAAKAMGTTSEKVRQMSISESDDVLSKSGGCKSQKFETVIQEGIAKFGEHQKYLADVADLMRRNPGRKVFR
jgi:hypothetical protein